MENEGIMALPMEAPMSQQEPMTVSSADAYDAAKTALGMTDPAALEMMKESLREDLADVDFTPDEIDQMIEVLEYLTRNPDDYGRVIQDLISRDMMDPGDFPDQYDPTFIGAALAVLNELKMGRVEGAMAPMQAGPGMAPMAMAQGGLADMAQYLASRGRNGDTMLAHITPDEARMLQAQGGSGTINPETGLPEYFKKFFKKVGTAVKKVLASPVGRIIGTIALAAVLGPTSIGLALGKAGTVALASGAVTAAGGGNLKQVLTSAALGYVGGGGTIGGFSPLQSLGSVLPGAGTALGTGLTTGVLGTGAGLLMGMKPKEALKMGATAGLISGGIAGLQGAPATGVSGAEAAGPPAPGAGPTAPATGPGIGQIGSAQDIMSMPMAEAGQMPMGQGLPSAPTDTPLPPPVPTPGGEMPMAQAGTPTIPDYAAPAYPPPAPPPSTFFGRMAQGAGDLYNQYLSPSRPGLAADAGILQKYGPLALAGTAVAGAAGAFKSPKVDASAADRAREPMPFQYVPGGSISRPTVSGGNVSVPSVGAIIPPTPQVPQIPQIPESRSIQVGQIPPTYVPPGLTNTPLGIAQLYNQQMYFPQPQPQYMNQGGTAEFPRKTGPINGPGTGTSDSIPAMLSDGEFVFTAKAVRNAGGGSRRKGAKHMYRLMRALEHGGPVRA
jgi:hypothetical protein